MTLIAHAANQENGPSLRIRHTNWDEFIRLANQRLTLNIVLKTKEGIERVSNPLNNTIQCADSNATSDHKGTLEVCVCTIIIKQKLKKRNTQRCASGHSCKGLHLQNPLIIPSGKRSKN